MGQAVALGVPVQAHLGGGGGGFGDFQRVPVRELDPGLVEGGPGKGVTI